MILKLTEAGTRKTVLFDPTDNLVYIKELGDAKPRTLIQTKAGPLEVEDSLEDIMYIMKASILISVSVWSREDELDVILTAARNDNRSSYRLCLMQKVRE